MRDGVRHQIAHRPLHESAVQFSNDRFGSGSSGERDTAIFSRSFVVVTHPIQQFGDIDALAMQVGQRALRLEPRTRDR